MITLHISGRSYEVDDKLQAYTKRKLGKLDRYLPRQHKPKGMNVEIFRDPSGKEDNRYRVKAHLEVPGPDIIAEAATMNPHAAIDIVAEKLKLQIRKYKDKHQPKRFRIKEFVTRNKDEE